MILGTRGSKLALIQTDMVRDALSSVGIETSIQIIESSGDMDRESPLYRMNSNGAFVDFINEKVASGEIDAAVHSAKDIPSRIPEELEISAVLERDDPRDALVSKYTLKSLPDGAVIGTSSMRRAKAIENMRDDLKVVNIRGNIDTRIRKLESGEYDGIVVAASALKRMGYNGHMEILDIDTIVPAASQGIIAVVSKKGESISEELARINHERTKKEMAIERELAESLSLGCSAPVGIFARCNGHSCEIKARFYGINRKGFFDFHFSDCTGMEDIRKKIVDGIPDGFGYVFP